MYTGILYARIIEAELQDLNMICTQANFEFMKLGSIEVSLPNSTSKEHMVKM